MRTPTSARADADPPAGGFDEAYRRLRPGMVRLAHLLTGSVEAAEDVVHDAFLACSRRWSTLESPDAYVRRAVVNQARSSLRQAGRDRDKADRFGRAAPVTVGMPDIDDLWDALRLLPDRQRMALVLRFYQDLALADIAGLLDCRLGTVKSLIHRGLARLSQEVRP